MTKTSTDQWSCTAYTSKFQEACLQAALDDEAFTTFRTQPEICGIIENRPVEWISSMMESVSSSGLMDIGNAVRAAIVNDVFGCPIVGEWQGVPISGTSATYLMYCAMVKSFFPNLYKMNIAEIGGGYGGFASVMIQCERPMSYTIYDIDEPLALAKKFIGKTCIAYPAIEYKSTIDNKRYDLLVSFCALSEFNEEGFDRYAEILRRADNGLVVWNSTDESLDWAKDLNQVAGKLSEITRKRVARGTEVNFLKKHFPSLCGYTFVWMS